MSIEALIQKWSGPTGLMVIIGGIVWGVQLNLLTLSNAERITALAESSASVYESQRALAESLAVTASALEQTTRQIDRIEQRLERAEDWIYEGHRKSP